jgi:hypothetical protein
MLRRAWRARRSCRAAGGRSPTQRELHFSTASSRRSEAPRRSDPGAAVAEPGIGPETRDRAADRHRLRRAVAHRQGRAVGLRAGARHSWSTASPRWIVAADANNLADALPGRHPAAANVDRLVTASWPPPERGSCESGIGRNRLRRTGGGATAPRCHAVPNARSEIRDWHVRYGSVRGSACDMGGACRGDARWHTRW